MQSKFAWHWPYGGAKSQKPAVQTPEQHSAPVVQEPKCAQHFPARQLSPAAQSMSVAQAPPGAAWQVKLPVEPWFWAQVRPSQQPPPQGDPNLGQQTVPVDPGRVEQSAAVKHSAALPQAEPSVLPHLPELVSQSRDRPEQHWSVRVHCATPGAGVPEFVQSRQVAHVKVPVAAASLHVRGEQQSDV